MNKKILVLVESLDRASSGGKANLAIIKNLNLNFEVTVAHYSKKPLTLHGIKLLYIPERKISGFYFLSRLQRLVQRKTGIILSHFLENIFGFSFTFFNDTKSIKKEFSAQFCPNDFDLLITLSQGASFRPHYAVLNLLAWHKKWLAYIHDPYPFYYYPYPYGYKQAGHNFKKIFFEEISQKAAYIGFPSLLLQKWMTNYFPKFKGKSLVIPHQLYRNYVEDLEVMPGFNSTNFNILHAGNLIGGRSPEGLLKGFAMFLKHNPNSKGKCFLWLLGPHNYYKELIEVYKNKTNQIIVSDGYVDYSKALWAQQNASVNVILEGAGKISPFLPGKFPHCIAANKPILALTPKKSELRRLMGKKYLYMNEPNDYLGIKYSLQKIFEDWLIDNELKLNRNDLREYISADFLKEVLNKI